MVLFVGDISEGSIKILKKINLLNIPAFVILGNHDKGRDRTGEKLQKQINLLRDKFCGWDLKIFNNQINILGGRPCSSGGGYFLSKEVLGVYGPLSENDSANKIINSYLKGRDDLPLILLAHAGPSGLGSEPDSICGRDWLKPSLDWGDRDLSRAITKIRKKRFIDLVIFGHMHNVLKRNLGERKMYELDRNGTSYLNTAVVPRYKENKHGELIINYSWVEFKDKKLKYISQRWYTEKGTIEKEKIFFRNED